MSELPLGAMTVTLVALALLLLCLAIALIVRRSWRLRGERRRAMIAEPLAPVLDDLTTGATPQIDRAVAILAALDTKRWEAVEPHLEQILPGSRWETHYAIIGLLERRGILRLALRRTRSRSGVARAHGAEVLGAARKHTAVPRLLALLKDRDPEVRQVAARGLGRVGDPAAARPLMDALSADRDVPPRLVARAVTRIGPPAHHALTESLRNGTPLQRAMAAEIAGLSGARPLTSALTTLLSTDPELEVRIRCARALGRLRTRSALQPLIDATRPDEPAPLRTVSTKAIGHLGYSAAIPHLAVLLTDRTHGVASNAAYALTQCGTRGLAVLTLAGETRRGAHAREALAVARLRGQLPAPAVTPVTPRRCSEVVTS